MQDFLTSINYNSWVLPAILLIPLVGALVILIQSALSHDDGSLAAAPSARWVALITFAVELVVSLGLWWSFDPGSSAWQARVSVAWIPQWGARFDMGIDGISLFMVLLNTL
jgi:NADH-quinone oxidoreductase subunit M